MLFSVLVRFLDLKHLLYSYVCDPMAITTNHHRPSDRRLSDEREKLTKDGRGRVRIFSPRSTVYLSGSSTPHSRWQVIHLHVVRIDGIARRLLGVGCIRPRPPSENCPPDRRSGCYRVVSDFPSLSALGKVTATSGRPPSATGGRARTTLPGCPAATATERRPSPHDRRRVAVYPPISASGCQPNLLQEWAAFTNFRT